MASAGGGDGGGSQREASAMDYVVPLNSSQSEGYEEYSHLQH